MQRKRLIDGKIMLSDQRIHGISATTAGNGEAIGNGEERQNGRAIQRIYISIALTEDPQARAFSGSTRTLRGTKSSSRRFSHILGSRLYRLFKCTALKVIKARTVRNIE